MAMQTRTARCFAERHGALWVAHCIDFSLAVQGDSLEEVRQKLHEQVDDYVSFINEHAGEEFARQLAKRRSPLPIRLRYWHLVVRNWLSRPIPKSGRRGGSRDGVAEQWPLKDMVIC